MTPQPVVIVTDDPAFQAQLEHSFADPAYAAIPQPWAPDAPAHLAPAQPAAVVVTLPSAGPPQQERDLLAQLQQDPALRDVPVVVCCDRPAVLQSAVQALQPRPGRVLASPPDVAELPAQLHAAQTAAPQA